MTVQATAVVTFGSGSSGADYVFEAVLDDTLNIGEDSSVLTSFAPGDDIYLQVHKSSNVDIVEVSVTSGSVAHVGSSVRSTGVTNLFTSRETTEDQDSTFTTSHAPTSCTVSYIGRVGGLEQSLTPVGQFQYTPDKRKTPFIARFDYTYSVAIYKWTAPTMVLEEDEEFEMAIVFYINVR